MHASNLNENQGESRHQSSWEMPLPPAVPTAKLSLVKQLNLFLELEAMFMNGSLDDAVLKDELNNDLNDNSESDEFFLDDFEQDSGRNEINSSSNIGYSPNKALRMAETVKQQQQELTNITKLPVEQASVINGDEFALIDDIESDVDGDDVNVANTNSEQMNVLLNLNRAETLKPLIPSYFYESDGHYGHSFLNKNEPLIGREWVFKEIEKVSVIFLNYFD